MGHTFILYKMQNLLLVNQVVCKISTAFAKLLIEILEDMPRNTGEKTHKVSTRTSGGPTEIRIKHLLNKSIQC